MRRTIPFTHNGTLWVHNREANHPMFSRLPGQAEAGQEGNSTWGSDTIQECSHRGLRELRNLQRQACLSDHR
jgi:hypothetical protein